MILAVKFLDSNLDLHQIKLDMDCNSEKPAVKVLFNVKTYVLEEDLFLLIKEFIPEEVISWIMLFLLLGAGMGWIVWGLIFPLFIVGFLICLWGFLTSPPTNFVLFKMMLRRKGFKGKVVML